MKTLLDSWETLEDALDFIYENKTITYHRPPTQGEIRFGYGATHYRDFEPIECVKPNGELKKWFVCSHDGLRYYR